MTDTIRLIFLEDLFNLIGYYTDLELYFRKSVKSGSSPKRASRNM